MKPDSRSELLAAAQKLFIAKGYSSVGTREIAEAAGVNLSLIKYHFGSKEDLFVETVKSLMEQAGGSLATRFGELQIDSKERAAQYLGEIISTIIYSHLLESCPQPCRVMFREVLSDDGANSRMIDELVSAVVADYILPTDSMMRKILRVLAPAIDDREIDNIIHSIFGQCSFYITHRPFVEKLRGRNFSERTEFESVLSHVVRFTLRGIDPHIGQEIETLAVSAALNHVHEVKV